MQNFRAISLVTWKILKIFKITRFQIVGHFEFLIMGSRGRNLSVIWPKSVPSGPNFLINMGDIS